MRVPFLGPALAGLYHASVTGSILRNASLAPDPRGWEAMALRRDDGGYHYLPESNTLVCACAKCGTTSLYSLVYFELFGKNWTWDDSPYMQDVISWRWMGKFRVLDSDQAAKTIRDNNTFSFALYRDPKERLISSWKSKVACGEEWETDTVDRSIMVPKLRALAGRPTADCLSFEDFTYTLAEVHRHGLAAELDIHFRPQNLGCFREFGFSEWTTVATAGNTFAGQTLANHVGKYPVKGFPFEHRSIAKATLEVTERAKRLLEFITHDEYMNLHLTPVSGDP